MADDQLAEVGDALAASLDEILDNYEISMRGMKTRANRALKQWKRMQVERAEQARAMEAGEPRQPGDLPCPATGADHNVDSTPTRWFNRCGECGEAWPG